MSRSKAIIKKSDGFTLVELTIAMVFVGFILLFMALTIVQMLRTYDKGIAMKQVNQAGRSTIDDISRAVKSQLPNDIRTDNINQGALCINRTMYVWNPLYTGTDINSATIVTGAAAHDAVIGNPASGGMMARKTLQNQADPCLPSSATVPAEDSTLLSNRARVLWATIDRTDTRLIKLTFVIGTYARNEFVPTSTPKYTTPTLQANRTFSCLPGNDGNYCAFSEFSTVIYLSREQ